MRLVKVRIEGFRNISGNQITFEDGICALVSANSYGKSNVMNAIDFAAAFIKADRETKKSMMSWIYGIPFNKHLQNKNFVADFDFVFNDNGKEFFVNYGYEFIWIKNEGGKKIVGEWLYVKEKGSSQKYSKLVYRKGNAMYKASIKGRCNTLVDINNDELVINKLLDEDNLYYHAIIHELNSFNVHLESHLDASKFYLQDPLIPTDHSRLNLNSLTNIPRTIYTLKKEYPEKYEILEDAFLQLFPNIESIDVKEIDIGEVHNIKLSKDAPYIVSNKVYSIFVQDKNLNQPMDFRTMSDGAKRVFLILTCTSIADINNISLIEFEEPENSVHPGLLQSYLRALYQLAGSCRILVASHSPYIVQYLNTENIYVGKPNNQGLAKFSRIENRKINQFMRDASAENDSIGDYLFELLTGSEDEVEILLNYLEK